MNEILIFDLTTRLTINIMRLVDVTIKHLVSNFPQLSSLVKLMYKKKITIT